jgi:hypothetical protein
MEQRVHTLMAHCGRNTKQITAYGVGYGGTRKDAVKVGEILVDIVARGLGQDSIAEQECPDDCPYREERVDFTGGKYVDYAAEIAKNYWIAVVKRRAVAVLICHRTTPKQKG